MADLAWDSSQERHIYLPRLVGYHSVYLLITYSFYQGCGILSTKAKPDQLINAGSKEA